MRKKILKTGLLAVLLIVLLVPLAHLLSSGQDDLSENDAAHTVVPMLEMLAVSPTYCAVTEIEPIMELEDAWAVEDTRTESEAPLVIGMRNGDHELGYDEESRTFYCTIGMEMGDTWPELALFAQQAAGKNDLRVAWIDDYAYDYPADSVRDGWRYELLAYTDTQYEYIGVVFTGLPIVSLQVEGGAEALGEEYIPARMAVSGAGYDGVNSGAMVHLRGGGFVKEYPKLSYRVELHTLNTGGDTKNDVSVLGMPADSDWILISNAADEYCARNELAWDLWRDWNVDGRGFMLQQTRMVEVFVENEYVGIYQIMQRIRPAEEIARMGGDPNESYCARVIKDVNIENRPVIDLMNRVNFWAELRHAPAGVSAKHAFAQFEPYWQMNVQFAGQHLELSDEEFTALAQKHTDVKEMMDFFLFTQAAGLGYDNVFNNVYMWAVKEGDRYVYHLSPWDMDMAFIKMLGYEEDTLNYYLRQAYRMLNLNVADSQRILYEIWDEKRATILSDDAMYQRVEAFQEYMNASGAYLRESEKWYGGARELDLREIQAFAVSHLSTIDRDLESSWPRENVEGLAPVAQ